MLSSDRKFAGFTAAALSCLVLAGCTIAPVHSGASGTNAINLTYAEPSTRLEQIFYRHVSAGFAGSASSESGQLTASVRVTNSRLGLANVVSPVNDYHLAATVIYNVTREGQIVTSGSRTATASYQTTGQTLGDDAARASAEEQAVRAAAEQVRLVLLGELSST